MELHALDVVQVVAAAIGGAAIGLEREWSGHASGPETHFGGIRTFTLLGGLAGLAGWLWRDGYELLAAVLLAGGAALVVAAYAAASRRRVDGTTEVAALVTLAAGVFAGVGQLAIASAVVAVTVLLLVEKSRLHAMVRAIDDTELRAGIRFSVMAVVILPLLPAGPYGPYGGIRPRELWILVLLFSALSFAGYVARRVVGSGRGYLLTGLLGGLVSSTSVTLLFARTSRSARAPSAALAFGVTAACTITFLRMVLATAILHWELAVAAMPYVVAPVLVGALLTFLGTRLVTDPGEAAEPPQNPLGFSHALQMAALFQAVLFAVHVVAETWGDLGLLVSGAVLGLTDVDALTISMVRSASSGVPAVLAARALAIGALSNTVFKLALALAIGRPRFRRIVAPTLAAIAVAATGAIVFLG